MIVRASQEDVEGAQGTENPKGPTANAESCWRGFTRSARVAGLVVSLALDRTVRAKKMATIISKLPSRC